MPTRRKISHSGWIALGLVLATAAGAAGQTYQQRDQQQILDQLRIQRQQSEQRLDSDLRRQQQMQDLRSQQQQLDEQIRRQQLREQLERQQLDRLSK